MPEIQLNQLVEINPLRPKIDLNLRDEVSFIPMNDVSESGRWVNHQSRRFGDVFHGYTYFEEGDVLFAKITPCMENGKGCYARNLVNRIGFASTEFHVMRAKNNADPGFIFQWSIYKPLRLKASATMIGSAGQQRVPASFLCFFKVPAIAKKEQTKIAKILSTVDRAIEQTEALIAKQQRIKTGLMQDLLTRGIDEHGNLRSEKTHQFKDSPLGPIPVEWEVQTVDELLGRRVLIGVQDGNHGEKHPKGRDFVEEGIPFVMASDMSDGFIDVARTNKITEQQYLGLRVGFAMPGDVLLSHKASIGFVAVVPDSLPRLMLTPQVTYYRVGDFTTLLPEYLAQFFRSEVFQEKLKGLAKQSTRDYIGILAQRKVNIALPTRVAEQRKIAAVLSTQDERCSALCAALDKFRATKTALMQDLLTGKVRVAS